MEHDGRTFGIQEILDDNLLIKTSFVKRFGGDHGGDWTMRLEANPTVIFIFSATFPINLFKYPFQDAIDNTTLYSFIVYFALDAPIGKLRPKLVGKEPTQYIESIEGEHPQLGRFNVHFSSASNVIGRSFLATDNVDLSQVKELIITGTGVIQVQSSFMNYYMSLIGYVPKEQAKSDSSRFLAVQFTVMQSTAFEVIFESASFKDRPNRLTGSVYEEELKVS